MIISSRIQTIYTYNSSPDLFKSFEETETTRSTDIITMHVLVLTNTDERNIRNLEIRSSCIYS